jgi:prolyl oligopeptidase
LTRPDNACGGAWPRPSRWLPLLLGGLLTLPFALPSAMSQSPDPYLWLEDVQGERALDWVRQRNAETEAQLQAQAGFDERRRAIREVLDSRDQIPYVTRRGEWLYNFWRDAEHPRGLWRRTTLAEYRKSQPA